MEESSDAESSCVTKERAKKKNKKSGGFQSLNLSTPIFRAIMRKGYKVPTPIQRKVIPVIMEGKNVVAMARTGSGKTAAFLVPMLERLKRRIAKAGARALIFSPTRELAMQTMKFTKELSINTDLKTIVVLGGENIENQFAAMHESPDIIIATPGRFLHLIIEMDLKLSAIEYLVLDEADRLFEMGFQEQLKEVFSRLPSERQSLLFSATLPKVLVDFVKAGVDDPVLIRLDVDLQISENLKSTFLLCRTDDKTAALLHLLKNVVDLQKELTVVFFATKHHIEYAKDILERADIPCTYIYSSLDQMARSINIGKFRNKKVSVLLVTDIAARGIDIPLLDNVINFNFPALPKLYVHRVGRVARAGRSGRAFSLIASDEAPYLLDLHLFLGKPVVCAKVDSQDEDGMCGSVPQNVIDEEMEHLRNWHEFSVDLSSMLDSTHNAMKKYTKTRTAPSSESIKRVKGMSFASVGTHPIFKDNAETERNKMLAELKNYRPNLTVFEFGMQAKSQAHIVMNKKRKAHGSFLKPRDRNMVRNVQPTTSEVKPHEMQLEIADETDLQIFSQPPSVAKKSVSKKKSVKQPQIAFKDAEHYLPYTSSEHYKEKGLGLENTFESQASNAILDLTGDDEETVKAYRNVVKWDRKRKKFIRPGNEELSKRMKTENGLWIPKSFKSDLYKKWKEKNKVRYQENDYESDDDERTDFKQRANVKRKNLKNFKGNMKGKQMKGEIRPRREMKTKDEIMKSRNRKQRLMDHQKKKNANRSHHKGRGQKTNFRKR